MSSARDIAVALGGRCAQRLADGSFLVPCPVPSHGKERGDRSPSLRIGDGQTRLLVRCFAGCDPRDVLDELRRRGLLDDARRTSLSARACAMPAAAENEVRQRNAEAAARIWKETVPIAGTAGEAYLARRGIELAAVPNYGGLRWHPRCPWCGHETLPCIVSRFGDALTGEPRGIHRRPINGETPRTLGPMRGCVIRLWPDDAVTTGLVIGEGVETVLAAATRIEHRGTLLQPAWAAGNAGNLAELPVLAGIEALTILVDHDASGTGQDAATACARRWLDAGRELVRLTPKIVGTDFNDIGSAA
jgi:putative DNA primase/helicase